MGKRSHRSCLCLLAGICGDEVILMHYAAYDTLDQKGSCLSFHLLIIGMRPEHEGNMQGGERA